MVVLSNLVSGKLKRVIAENSNFTLKDCQVTKWGSDTRLSSGIPRPKASAIQFTVDQTALAATRLKKKGEARNASKTGTVSTKAAQKAAWAAVDTTKGMSFEAAKRKAMQEKQVEEDSKVCLNCSS